MGVASVVQSAAARLSSMIRLRTRRRTLPALKKTPRQKEPMVASVVSMVVASRWWPSEAKKLG